MCYSDPSDHARQNCQPAKNNLKGTSLNSHYVFDSTIQKWLRMNLQLCKAQLPKLSTLIQRFSS